MKLISKKENQIIFKAEISESLANAIRKYLNQIPVLAIDEVEISKNDSPLYDETITHRLGLIPLKMEKSITEEKIERIKLNVKKEGIIYSNELKGKIRPVYDNIPITSLNKDRELMLTATAKLDRGSEHSRFSPGIMFYKNGVNIKVDKDCPTEIIKVCPQKVFVLENNKVIIKESDNCDMCDACINFCEKRKKDFIKITPTEELIINLEGFGQMPVAEIFKKAIDVLKKDLNDISKKIWK